MNELFFQVWTWSNKWECINSFLFLAMLHCYSTHTLPLRLAYFQHYFCCNTSNLLTLYTRVFQLPIWIRTLFQYLMSVLYSNLQNVKALLFSNDQKRIRVAQKINLFIILVELWYYDSRNLCAKKVSFSEYLYGRC